jgi:hypothetical protein
LQKKHVYAPTLNAGEKPYTTNEILRKYVDKKVINKFRKSGIAYHLPNIFIGGGPIFPHAARPWVPV